MLASAPKALNAVSKDAPVICTTPFGKDFPRGPRTRLHSALAGCQAPSFDRYRIRNGGFPRPFIIETWSTFVNFSLHYSSLQ